MILPKRVVLTVSVAMAVIVAILDWWTGPGLTLGAIYLAPVVLAAFAASRGEVLMLALVCAVARGVFAGFAMGTEFFVRLPLAFAAYASAALLLQEVLRRESIARQHLEEMRRQEQLRQELEEHLSALAESSPAAIFTTDGEGRVLSANREAQRLFGVPDGSEMRGVAATEYLPVLAGALRLPAGREPFRSSAECQGHRANGDQFLAQVWFSFYQSGQARRLAVIAVDTSEDVRDREDQNMRLLAEQNRIMFGAMSHELRNLSAATQIALSNLRTANEETAPLALENLGKLVSSLHRLSSLDLATSAKPISSTVNLQELLGQFRVLTTPLWQECGGVVDVEMESGSARVHADPAGLLQVLLNLSSNSLRAVECSAAKVFTVVASRSGHEVQVRISDTGPGIAPGVKLFEPFQVQAKGVGLGLYVSRAMIRSYGGDLVHEPSTGGCVFCIRLRAALPAR